MTEQFLCPPLAAIDPIRAAIHKIKNHSGSVLVVNPQTKLMETARELLLSSDIEAIDYGIIKDQCNEKINKLGAGLSNLNKENHTILNIKPIAEEALNSLHLFYEFYEKV